MTEYHLGHITRVLHEEAEVKKVIPNNLARFEAHWMYGDLTYPGQVVKNRKPYFGPGRSRALKLDFEIPEILDKIRVGKMVHAKGGRAEYKISGKIIEETQDGFVVKFESTPKVGDLVFIEEE